MIPFRCEARSTSERANPELVLTHELTRNNPCNRAPRGADVTSRVRQRFERVGAPVCRAPQDIAPGVPLTEAFELRLLTPYSTWIEASNPPVDRF